MSLMDNLIKRIQPTQAKIDIIRCDNCNYEMQSDEIKFHFTTVDKKRKIKRKYFMCPHCKTKYSTEYEDDNIYLNFCHMNEIRKEIQKYERKALKGANVKDEIQDLIKKYELMYCENLAISKKYRQEFEQE